MNSLSIHSVYGYPLLSLPRVVRTRSRPEPNLSAACDQRARPRAYLVGLICFPRQWNILATLSYDTEHILFPIKDPRSV